MVGNNNVTVIPNLIPMNNLSSILIDIDKGKYTTEEMVSILVLIESNININTISGMSRSENKTPRGIRISNQYRKVSIGNQLMVVKGLKDFKLPF